MYQNSHLYNFYEFYKSALVPVNFLAKLTYGSLRNSSIYSNLPLVSNLDIIERLTRSYEHKGFCITEVEIDGKTYNVEEKVILSKDFCQLKLFQKNYSSPQPKMLVVAPMAGHYATLLKDTVKSLLPYYEVYVTDWINASNVPLSKGNFDLDDYIDYTIEFMEVLSPNLNVIGVCQPTVPVLCAASYMAEKKNPKRPKSLILIGGPIDTRQNPTEVNTYAMTTPLEWIENNLITIVPFNKPGFMRAVYPGFIQLFSFMSMNLDRHVNSHFTLYEDLLSNNTEAAEKQKMFYDEYLTVMDLPAEFFLQTILKVFQKHDLPLGRFYYRKHKIDPQKITDIAILGIEGEKDDITGIGQTKAALDLCVNLPEAKKCYHLQLGVGHYGVFSGSKFRSQIVPIINKFINKN
jgi:poly(3-hydroxybutyrate) depolymerase